MSSNLKIDSSNRSGAAEIARLAQDHEDPELRELLAAFRRAVQDIEDSWEATQAEVVAGAREVVTDRKALEKAQAQQGKITGDKR